MSHITQNKGSDIQNSELSMWEWLLNESKLSLINPAVDLSLIKISFFIVKVFSKADEDYIQTQQSFPSLG